MPGGLVILRFLSEDARPGRDRVRHLRRPGGPFLLARRPNRLQWLPRCRKLGPEPDRLAGADGDERVRVGVADVPVEPGHGPLPAARVPDAPERGLMYRGVTSFRPGPGLVT